MPRAAGRAQTCGCFPGGPAARHPATKSGSRERRRLPAVQKGPGGTRAGLGGHAPGADVRHVGGQTAACRECRFWPRPVASSEREPRPGAVGAVMLLCLRFPWSSYNPGWTCKPGGQIGHVPPSPEPLHGFPVLSHKSAEPLSSWMDVSGRPSSPLSLCMCRSLCRELPGRLRVVLPQAKDRRLSVRSGRATGPSPRGMGPPGAETWRENRPSTAYRAAAAVLE